MSVVALDFTKALQLLTIGVVFTGTLVTRLVVFFNFFCFSDELLIYHDYLNNIFFKNSRLFKNIKFVKFGMKN